METHLFKVFIRASINLGNFTGLGNCILKVPVKVQKTIYKRRMAGRGIDSEHEVRRLVASIERRRQSNFSRSLSLDLGRKYYKVT